MLQNVCPCKVRDFVTFSFINHVTLLEWVTGRGKGHPGMVNTPRGSGRAKKGSRDFWTAPKREDKEF